MHGGLYMTAAHIDIIHGDHFVSRAEPCAVVASQLADLVAIAQDLPNAGSLKLVSIIDRPVYVVAGQSGPTPSMSPRVVRSHLRRTILELADQWHTGSETVENAELIRPFPTKSAGASRRRGGWAMAAGTHRRSISCHNPASLSRIGTSCGACSTSY